MHAVKVSIKEAKAAGTAELSIPCLTDVYLFRGSNLTQVMGIAQEGPWHLHSLLLLGLKGEAADQEGRLRFLVCRAM